MPAPLIPFDATADMFSQTYASSTVALSFNDMNTSFDQAVGFDTGIAIVSSLVRLYGGQLLRGSVGGNPIRFPNIVPSSGFDG